MNKQWMTVVFAVAASVATFAAQARRVDVRGLAYDSIGTYTSHAGETLDAFLERIRPTMRAFTDKTGFEACGEIAKAADGSFGIVIGSSDSHVGCAVFTAKVPEGMTAMGETIHTHPILKRFYANPNDRILLAAMGIEEYDLLPLNREDPYHFSPGDYAGGPATWRRRPALSTRTASQGPRSR